MLPLYITKFGAFRENIISRATSGGRREIELNSGSLPPIPEALATLAKGLRSTLESSRVGRGPISNPGNCIGVLKVYEVFLFKECRGTNIESAHFSFFYLKLDNNDFEILRKIFRLFSQKL